MARIPSRAQLTHDMALKLREAKAAYDPSGLVTWAVIARQADITTEQLHRVLAGLAMTPEVEEKLEQWLLHA